MDSPTDLLARRIGFFAAIAATLLMVVFDIAFVIAGVAHQDMLAWSGMEHFLATYQSGLMVGLTLPVFLLAPTLLVLMAALNRTAQPERQILSLIALAFTAVYAAQISLNYYVQMTVVRLNVAARTTDGLGLLAFFNPNSVAMNLEVLGYGMLCIALLFAAFLFRDGRRDRVIFWLFLINGVLNVYYIFDPFIHLGGPPIVLMLFNVSFPVATALIALRFRAAAT